MEILEGLSGYKKNKVVEIASAIQSYPFLTVLKWGKDFYILVQSPKRYSQNKLY